MDSKIVEKLRRNQQLRELPDGREGIEVTVQFVGPVPHAPRPERKDWLEQHFSAVQQQLDNHLDIKPESLSVSAQSIEAVVPVDEFDDIRERLSHEDMRLEVTRMVNVLE